MARKVELHNPKLTYIRSLYAKEDHILENIKKSIPVGHEGMVIGPEEGKIIYILLQLIKAKYVLEIGTFVGYSTIWLARSIQPDGLVISIEKNTSFYELAQKNILTSGIENRIKLLQGKGLDVLSNLTHDFLFDAVFIDADKANYLTYLELILPKLRTGGIIIADNTLLFDTIYRDEPIEDLKLSNMWREMRKFNDILSDEKLFQSVMFPTIEGLTIAIKK